MKLLGFMMIILISGGLTPVSGVLDPIQHTSFEHWINSTYKFPAWYETTNVVRDCTISYVGSCAAQLGPGHSVYQYVSYKVSEISVIRFMVQGSLESPQGYIELRIDGVNMVTWFDGGPIDVWLYKSISYYTIKGWGFSDSDVISRIKIYNESPGLYLDDVQFLQPGGGGGCGAIC